MQYTIDSAVDLALWVKYIIERSLALAEHVSPEDSMGHKNHISATIGHHLEHFLYSSCFVWKVRYIKTIISIHIQPP